jgi:hypothetical protein
MFVHPDDDPREDGGNRVGERDNLVGYLRDRRLTLEMKCAGLTPAQLAERSVPPSNLSLLGLVRHLAGVERDWFRIKLAGHDGPRLYRTEESPNADFEDAVGDPELVADAFARWKEEIAFAEKFVADTPDLGYIGPEGDELRSVMIHMIEEYARHCGHADFLRERIDGRVGQ